MEHGEDRFHKGRIAKPLWIIEVKSDVTELGDLAKHANLLEQRQVILRSKINLAKRYEQPDLTPCGRACSSTDLSCEAVDL